MSKDFKYFSEKYYFLKVLACFLSFIFGDLIHAIDLSKMLVRTTLNQVTSNIYLMNAEGMGEDLMEISAHAGARPSHAGWKG